MLKLHKNTNYFFIHTIDSFALVALLCILVVIEALFAMAEVSGIVWAICCIV